MHLEKNRKGISLIIVISTLMALSLLGISFSRTAMLERAAAQNTTLFVQARFNAYSGLDRAFLLLKERMEPYPEFILTAANNEKDWVFKDDDGNAIGTGRTLNNARNSADAAVKCIPSYAARDSGTNALLQVGDFFYSGLVNQSNTNLDNFNYALKVTDTSSQIDLNGPIDKLHLMMRSLFKHLSTSAGGNVLTATPTHAADWNAMAQRILQFRQTLPSQIFRTKEEIKDGNRLTNAEFEVLKDFFTVHTWRNPNTWAPPSLAFYEANKPNSIVDTQLNNSGFTLEARAPINVNTAPKAVLVAVLEQISGFARDAQAPGTDPVKKLDIKKTSATIDNATAISIADALIAARNNNPIKLWSPDNIPANSSSFNQVVNTALPSNPELSDLIKANANPNAMINRWIPNQERFQRVDKCDLAQPNASFPNAPTASATTEFCFMPSGSFEITSYGRVFSPVDGRLLAEAELEAVLELSEPQQHTTQQQFMTPNPISQSNVISFPETKFHRDNCSLANGTQDAVNGGSLFEGYIQLENPAIAGLAGLLGNLFFEANTFDDFWQLDTDGNGTGNLNPKILEKWPTEDHTGSSESKARSLFKGEFRNPEGAICFNYGSKTSEPPTTNGQMVAFDVNNVNLDAAQGCISMWIKFEDIDKGADEPFIYISHQLNSAPAPSIPDLGIVMKAVRYVSGGRNEIQVTRFIWEENLPAEIIERVIFDDPSGGSLENPQKLWSRLIISNIQNNRSSKKWYRLVIGWEDYTKVFAALTHDGAVSDTTAHFSFSESVDNTDTNTTRLEWFSGSEFKGGSNEGFLLAFGGYSFTAQKAGSVFNQTDVGFPGSGEVDRYPSCLISKIEIFNQNHISSSGSNFYEKPYPVAGTFSQNITKSGSGSFDVRYAEFTIWKANGSTASFDGNSIDPETGLLSTPVTVNAGQNIPYLISLTNADGGETSAIFDDITVHYFHQYPKFRKLIYK